jgi:class 3 adenylate cyclase/predicted HD phosphohydrolase
MQANEQKLLKRIAELQHENARLKAENNKLSNQFRQSYNNKTTDKQEDNQILQQDEVPARKEYRFVRASIMYASLLPSPSIDGQDVEAFDFLDEVLYLFNSIVSDFHVQRFSSLGDSLVCVAGIEGSRSTGHVELMQAALKLLSLFKQNNDKTVLHWWDVHIGIHTGWVKIPVKENVNRLSMIKGDTLNVASRISAVAAPNQILVSANTVEMVKDFYETSFFRSIPAKYDGVLHLYEIKGICPSLYNQRQHCPNERFNLQFAQLRFYDLQEDVLNMLERDLPDNLYYHNVKHTIDVLTGVEIIGWAEGIDEEEMLLLKTAALLHDTGHIVDYKNHEHHSTEIARKLLPDYSYNQQQIDIICKIIMDTQLPPRPTTLAGKIICDSDLDYLGREDFIPVSQQLFREMYEHGFTSSQNEWNKMQIDFISKHQYFTETALQLREVNKQKQIERIKKLIN